jgi:hypothetical protein
MRKQGAVSVAFMWKFVLGVATLVWNDWIELLFKVDPDAGDGSLEKAIVAVLVAAADMWLVDTNRVAAHAHRRASNHQVRASPSPPLLPL